MFVVVVIGERSALSLARRAALRVHMLFIV
jgi:hypothetical protein